MNITFIGGGNMAGALITGLLQKGVSPAEIGVVEVAEAARARLKQAFGVTVFEEISARSVTGGTVILAVKPQQLAAIALALQGLLAGRLVISIAAGVRSADISRWLGGHALLVRAMPNTPATVLAGVTGLYALEGVDALLRHQAETILGAVGKTFWLANEAQMDAITAISGSGPAYVFFFMEALQQAAVKLGFSLEEARLLVLETFAGAASLASQSGEEAATLRHRVTSPGGTTEAALLVMERAGVREAIAAAALAACARSRELGEELGGMG